MLRKTSSEDPHFWLPLLLCVPRIRPRGITGNLAPPTALRMSSNGMEWPIQYAFKEKNNGGPELALVISGVLVR